ncbi:MAG TPA: hypothetical protein VGN52_07805 [Burkholderiales bacterium]|jgi:hypothetical protein
MNGPEPDAPRADGAGNLLFYCLLSGGYRRLADAELTRMGNWLRFAAPVILLGLVCAFAVVPALAWP